jgi:hypothetical protein
MKMARVKIENGQLVITMKGMRKISAMKSELSIPLRNVESAAFDSGAWENTPRLKDTLKGFATLDFQKVIGADLYGYYFAGTFRQDGDRVFYDLKKKEDAVIITLKDEDFKHLIIGVDNPDEVVGMIQQALHCGNT